MSRKDELSLLLLSSLTLCSIPRAVVSLGSLHPRMHAPRSAEEENEELPPS